MLLVVVLRRVEPDETRLWSGYFYQGFPCVASPCSPSVEEWMPRAGAVRQGVFWNRLEQSGTTWAPKRRHRPKARENLAEAAKPTTRCSGAARSRFSRRPATKSNKRADCCTFAKQGAGMKQEHFRPSPPNHADSRGGDSAQAGVRPLPGRFARRWGANSGARFHLVPCRGAAGGGDVPCGSRPAPRAGSIGFHAGGGRWRAQATPSATRRAARRA
jgi:hypothetical protein